MNHFAARARHDGLTWIGEFRCAEHADFKPVLEGDGIARFPSRVDAQLAADRALRAYMNGRLRRDGATITSAKIAAEKLFRPGKKPIPVEVR